MKADVQSRFPPDGQLVCVGSNDEIHLIDVATREISKSVDTEPHRIDCVGLSPDGKILATGNDHHLIHLWDVATGELKQTIQTEWEPGILAFSPDGKTLASVGWRNIYLLDVNTGKIRKTLKGHIDSIFDITFSPDGRILASCGRDSTVILWEMTE